MSGGRDSAHGAPTHLGDADVGQLGAGGEVQLLQPAQGPEGHPGVPPQLVQVLLRHHLGPRLERQAGGLEEAHDAEGPGEARPLIALWSVNTRDANMRPTPPPAPGPTISWSALLLAASATPSSPQSVISLHRASRRTTRF